MSILTIRAARVPLLIAVPILVAAWSLAGFYASLGPALMHRVFGFDASLSGALALFVLAVSGAIAVLFARHYEPVRAMTLGASSLVLGTVIVTASIFDHGALAFFAGSAIAGAGFGAGFQGGVRNVVSLAAPAERAGLLSVIFVVSYVAMGAPAIVAGYLVTHGASITPTAFCVQRAGGTAGRSCTDDWQEEEVK